MIKTLFFACIFLLPVMVNAEEVELEQFAKGYELNTDGNAAIYKLSLPESVYQTTVRKDLGDIRVFNQDKKRVPHAIRKPQSTQEKEMIYLDLAFFPLLGMAINPEIIVADDGTIIQINKNGNFSTTENANIKSYIIDVSHVKHAIDELEFELIGVEGSFIKQARLQYSDNLNHWSSLINDFSIADLDYGLHKLHKNKIKLPRKKIKYLRFTWLDDNNGIQISNIKARLKTVWSSEQREKLTVHGKLTDSEKQLYEFDVGGQFLLDRINITLPEENTLIEVEVSSRNNEKSEWRRRYTGLIYKLQVKENSIENGEINISSTMDQLWQLQVKTEDGLGDKVPVFKFTWQPNELYFLARGQGPFTLAYGNGQINPPGKPVDILMDVLTEDQERNLVEEATLGAEINLMGEEALKAELKIPWQRILLWGVLMLGVLVLGIMVIRLYKQMSIAKNKQEKQ